MKKRLIAALAFVGLVFVAACEPRDEPVIIDEPVAEEPAPPPPVTEPAPAPPSPMDEDTLIVDETLQPGEEPATPAPGY